ncbi:hypothetical protein CGCSCA4_v008798 [Colletotrichum siamense]|uniref:Uncharacterized protein n=1 Tax=Colletotrichum siamense TaxID=690259 RepID=A0A9P5ERZ5_COLSI|nr:hypothetical protein CGCSCA4_v008798 [Colletotrichum siamense]KAF4858397.1 hypothetical protein CGCSCA2_v007379 [Colletotrichum siamense]
MPYQHLIRPLANLDSPGRRLPSSRKQSGDFLCLMITSPSAYKHQESQKLSMLDMLPNSTGKNWQEIHSGGSDVPNPQHRRVIALYHMETS